MTVILMKMRAREEGMKSFTQDKRAMHHAIAHHPLTNAQPPKQRLAPLDQLPQFLYWAWCSMVWNIPLARSGSSGCSLSAACAPGRGGSLAEHGKLEVLHLG